MSRLKKEELWSGVSLGRQVQVDLGKLGEIKFLNAYLKGYMRPAAEPLSPEKRGRWIDDGLVETISFNLQLLEGGDSDTAEFESTMDTIEEGIKAHPALLAFAMSLPKGEERVRPPLPSAKYLELARRHVRHGASPSIEEGRDIAGVLLAPMMNEALWETDWDRGSSARERTDSWLRSRDTAELWFYILTSERSQVAWDTLNAICQELVASGDEHIPNELITWGFRAAYGARQRPAEGPAPRHRPRKLGYIFRDNEIRHVVDRLVQVGMPKTDGYRAVGEGINREPITILRICRKPYVTVFDLAEEGMRRLEPSLYEYLYGPGSDSGLPLALRTFLESRPPNPR